MEDQGLGRLGGATDADVQPARALAKGGSSTIAGESGTHGALLPRNLALAVHVVPGHVVLLAVLVSLAGGGDAVL